jgi:hypothetical protein
MGKYPPTESVVPMNVEERRASYKAIEDVRERPLIVYATSTRLISLSPQMINVAGMMGGDAVREFIDQMDTIPNAKQVDILIHSTGGDPLAAWKLMSMLRERFQKVSVLVPFMAFSAATLFALGADEIVMHPHASLGPIDPQITVAMPDGKGRRFSYEDVGAFLRFLSSEVKITEQVHISDVIEKLFTVVDPVLLGAAKRASELSSSVGERLLLMHMRATKDKARAKQIAENLNKSFFAHGDAVSRSRARQLNLKIAPDNPELEKILWRAFLAIESYMEMRKPFAPLQHYLADPQGAAALAPPASISLPANTPPQLAAQIWQAAANNALQNAGNRGVEVDYTLVNALIESCRASTEFRTRGKISAFRNMTGETSISITDSETGWKHVEVEALGTQVTSQGSTAQTTDPAPVASAATEASAGAL